MSCSLLLLVERPLAVSDDGIEFKSDECLLYIVRSGEVACKMVVRVIVGLGDVLGVVEMDSGLLDVDDDGVVGVVVVSMSVVGV